MTISQTIRKRLRRYALFCLVAAATTSVAEMPQRSVAGETHDSGDLCGWIEEPSDKKFNQPNEIENGNASHFSSPQFFSVEFDQTLSIDTCSYDAWLTRSIKTDPIHAVVDHAVADVAVEEPLALEATHEPTSTATEVSASQVEAPEAATPAAVDGEVARTEAPVTEMVATPADDDATVVEALPATPSRTSSQFNAAIATIAAAASAGNPIPFGQWTEPFAMIGPDGSHTPKQIEAFQDWFVQGKRMVTEFVPVVDFDGEIDSPPIEAIAETDQSEPGEATLPSPDESEISEEDPLIGSSPFIVTIDEAYWPYDLAESDVESTAVADPVAVDKPESTATDEISTPQVVWADGLFSSQQHPFCIRSLVEMREPGWSPLAKSATEVPRQESPEVAAPAVQANEKVAVVHTAYGSADCLLDEMIWQVSVALEDERVTDQWLRPDRIGTGMASLVVSGDRLASRLASELALVWPADAKPANPIPGSGAKLLARAEAAEQLPAEEVANPFTPEQLAQADAMFRQWVDVTQSVIGDLSDRFNDVTEVARTRGTQDDSKRR